MYPTMGINGRPQTIIVGTIIVGTMLKRGLWYMETKGPPPWKQKEDRLGFYDPGSEK